MRDYPQQVRQFDVGSMLSQQPRRPQSTVPTALGAFDLDRRVRIVGQRVVQSVNERGRQLGSLLFPVQMLDALGDLHPYLMALWVPASL